MNDMQRHGLCLGQGGCRFRKDNAEERARFHLVARFPDDLTLDSDGPFRDKGLKPRPAHLRKCGRQSLVEAVLRSGVGFEEL